MRQGGKREALLLQRLEEFPFGGLEHVGVNDHPSTLVLDTDGWNGNGPCFDGNITFWSPHGNELPSVGPLDEHIGSTSEGRSCQQDE